MREQETAIITSIKSEIRWKEWEEQIRKQTSSGLTAKEWCRQNNINIKTYYYHLRRVREKLCEQRSQEIIPVNVPKEKPGANEIKIEKNSLQISLPSDVPAETLTALVRELC